MSMMMMTKLCWLFPVIPEWRGSAFWLDVMILKGGRRQICCACLLVDFERGMEERDGERRRTWWMVQRLLVNVDGWCGLLVFRLHLWYCCGLWVQFEACVGCFHGDFRLVFIGDGRTCWRCRWMNMLMEMDFVF